MIGKAKFGLAVVGILAVLAIGGAEFIGSGLYNIGADDHHTKVVLALIEQLRDRSIGVRARTIDVPQLEDPKRIAERHLVQHQPRQRFSGQKQQQILKMLKASTTT
jgi:hypothetical protein